MPKEAISSAEQKVERVQESPADYSTLPTHEESLFLHQNDYWIIRYHGRSALLKSTRALHCLAVLLRDPGREFHVRELLVRPMDASAAAVAMHHLAPFDPRSIVVNNAGTMTRKLSGQKLAVLGAGKLGGILLRAYLKQKLFSPKRVSATVLHGEKAPTLSKDLGVGVTSDNRKAVADADIVLLCMKPQVIREVLEEIRPHVGEKALVISVAASVPTSYIEQHLGPKVPVVRAMPNTCSAVGCGMTGICRGAHAAAEHLEMARAMFDAVGRTVVVDEKHMDAVTGLSASGPAFAYIILESLAEAGVKVGLPRDVATLLAAQTMKGSASVVLETGDHPALLKDAVTTPAGCTIDGILELEEGKLRVTLIKAVVKATLRAGELLFEK